ncbi:hypothetical protein F441_08512, partial [Phytophthora nicotianae CJ01A1]
DGLSQDEAADSKITFMESVLLIRLINAGHDSGSGNASGELTANP